MTLLPGEAHVALFRLLFRVPMPFLPHASILARRAAGALLCAASLAGCGGDKTVASDPATLDLKTVTTGSDVDADGYTYALDGNPSEPIGTNETVVLSGLAAGSHQLALGGVAGNCALAGGSPRSITLGGGKTTDVQLAVSCQAIPVTHPAGTVVGTASMTGLHYGVAVSPNGVIYAALLYTTTLARGDLATMTFSAEVTVGSNPAHVAFNPAGTTAFATLQGARGLAVVDVATNALKTTLTLETDGLNVAVSPSGARVYATTTGGKLYVVNAADNTVVTTVDVGPMANGLAFSPDGQTLYVSSRDAGTVVAVNTQTNAVARTYTLGGRPQRVAVAPDGSEVYVANESYGLNVINVSTGQVTSQAFGSAAAYGLGMTPDGAQLYVLLSDAGEVRVLDRATRAPVKTITVGGTPRNVAFTRKGDVALVTNEQAVVFIK